MCEKCDAIDARIIRYRRIASRIDDEMVLQGLVELVGKLTAEKAELHPEADKG
jgi:hypothetical protein